MTDEEREKLNKLVKKIVQFRDHELKPLERIAEELTKTAANLGQDIAVFTCSLHNAEETLSRLWNESKEIYEKIDRELNGNQEG